MQSSCWELQFGQAGDPARHFSGGSNMQPSFIKPARRRLLLDVAGLETILLQKLRS